MTPDYIQIGYVGNARTAGEPGALSVHSGGTIRLYVASVLMASPVLQRGDLNKMDELTSMYCAIRK